MKSIYSTLLFVVGLLLFTSSAMYGQGEKEDRVIDEDTEEALGYVNIGIVGKNIGTVSDINGNFGLSLPEMFDEEIVRFSMIGYSSKEYKVKELRILLAEKKEISLKESNTRLKEVVISSKELEEKILGNTTRSTNVRAGFESNELGNEVGVKIKVKKDPVHLLEFATMIVQNNYETIKFRLNIYSLKDGMPDQTLLTENIIKSTNIERGMLVVNLEEYNLIIDQDFYIGLEWIEDLGEDGLLFSCAPFKGPIISKQTSQGNWEIIKGFGLGFHVKVLQ